MRMQKRNTIKSIKKQIQISGHYLKYIFVVALFYSTTLFSISLSAASLYSITDLGPLTLTGYDNQNLKIQINDDNKIVAWQRKGNSTNSPSPLVGLSGDLINPLQPALTVTPVPSHAFYGLSNSNITVGYISNSQDKKTASMWDTTFGTQTSLGNLGLDDSFAIAINNGGQIVGNSRDNTNTTQPFLWANDVMSKVPINNSFGGTAEVINDNGLIGGSFHSALHPQAYFWDGTTLNILNNINTNVAMSWVSGVNNLDQAVGGMQISKISDLTNLRFLRTHAYIWDQTNGLVNIGENITGISWASAINEKQQIVGGRLIDILDRQAILWENGATFNLNSFVQTTENWDLHDATDINILGYIVGIGKLNGEDHAYLLQPFSEPAAASDLEITVTANSPNSKTRARAIDDNQVLAFSVFNHGPDDATDVQIESTLNEQLTVTNLTASKGTCSSTNQVINCTIPYLAVNDSMSISLDLNAEQTDLYQFEASVNSAEIDAGINYNNNVSKKVNVVARELTQSSPDANQNQDTTTQDNDESTPSNSTNPAESSDTDLTQAKSSGCSIGNNQNIDPLFYLLLMISILKIRHSRPSLTN